MLRSSFSRVLLLALVIGAIGYGVVGSVRLRPQTTQNGNTTGVKRMISETREEISVLVRSGFYGKQRLMEIFCEEMYEPGELREDEVSAEIDAAMSQLEKEMAGWPPITDCDRLDSVFQALNAQGIISLQNAGNTQSDGYDDCYEIYEASPNKNGIKGYCYYHGQDLERAVRGKGLLVSFGPVNPEEEETKGSEVGRAIQTELEKAGFKVIWKGTFADRISIPNLVWQKRINKR
jgi:hypothetical protein